jgi:Domain of unknown function (DUF4417)
VSTAGPGSEDTPGVQRGATHTRHPRGFELLQEVMHPLPPTPELPPLRLEYRDPAELAAHPRNWKAHGREQLDSISDLFDQVGFAGAFLFNERTGRLLDGHGRKEIWSGRLAPVLVGNWTEEQEAAILAYLDPTGWMSQGDRKKLNELMAGPFPALQTAAMSSLMDAVKATSRILDDDQGDEKKDDEAAHVSMPLDSIWPTDNVWSVPVLDAKLQADQVPHPVQTWGTIGARRGMHGTWHFYIHDHKFEPLWRRPFRVLWSAPSAAVEPNFSTTDQTPFALSLWHIYRKRWLARYWQSQGVRIFVDLNVSAELNQPHSGCNGAVPNLLGVPSGWTSYASRAHANQPDQLLEEWAVAQRHAGDATPIFLVVGGGKKVRQLARENGWVWVPEQVQRAHAEPGSLEEDTARSGG